MTEEKVDLTEREKVYGEFVDNMERTAKIWSGILGSEVKDYHVPLMMLSYKAFRSAQAPRYSDNTDDIEGWRQGLLRVIEKNYGGTIQARDVETYLAALDAEQEPATSLSEGELLATHVTARWDTSLSDAERQRRWEERDTITASKERRFSAVTTPVPPDSHAPLTDEDLAALEEIKESRRPSHLRAVPAGSVYDTESNATGRVIDAWSQNRCGYSLAMNPERNPHGGFCMKERGHSSQCDVNG